MHGWHCLYHCTAGSLTSLMEIRTYDPRSIEPLLYNLSYLVVLKFGPETVLSISIIYSLICSPLHLIANETISQPCVYHDVFRKETEAWFPKMTSVSVSHHVLPAE